MTVASIKTESSITVVIDFQPRVIPQDHPNFAKIAELIKNPNTTEADIKPLLDIPAAIETFTGGNVKVLNGRLFYRGFEVKTNLAKLILGMVKSGEADAAKPFELFLELAHSNPDPRAAQDLYDWVANSNLPITADGHFLAWKAVKENYRSIHSPNDARFDHSIGNIIEQPREECDSNPDQTCSSGLHFCHPSYLSNYAGGGSRVVMLKISPADVVAFPKDYNGSKGRACRYQSVGEVPMDKVATYYPQGVRVYRGVEVSTPVKNAKPEPVREGHGKFTVGDKWNTRGGSIATIKDVNGPDKRYPIVTTRGETFDLNGRYITKKADARDLLTKVA